jgi:hypothetical protein
MKRDDRCRPSICHAAHLWQHQWQSCDVTRASAPHTWRGSNKLVWCRCMRIPIVIKAQHAASAFHWPRKKTLSSIISFWGTRVSIYLKLLPCIHRAVRIVQFMVLILRADLSQPVYIVALSFARLVFLFWSQLVQLYAVALQHAAAPKVLGRNLKHPTARSFLFVGPCSGPAKLISIPAMVNIICF